MARYTVIIDDDGNEILYDVEGEKPEKERFAETLFSIAVSVQTDLKNGGDLGLAGRV